MTIHFTGHNVEVTPAIKEYTQNKFDKLLRHFDKIAAINVVFEIEKTRQIAEASIQIPTVHLHARAEADDLYKAIDDLTHKLDRQIISHKEKIRDHR